MGSSGGLLRWTQTNQQPVPGGRLNETDGEEAKDTERKRANCRGQGTRETQGGGKKGKREERETGGPEPSLDGKDSTLNIRDGV